MNHALALFVIWGAALFIIINKQTKEKLQFTQFAIDRSGDAAFWMGPDDQFIYVNEATCRSLGYSREELLQMTIYDIDPGLPREIGESLWQQIKENKYLSFEATHRRKDGTVFPVAIMSIYLEFQGKDYACQFARDITERKQAVNAVEKSEKRLRQLLDEMLEGCMIIGFDWTYLYINDAAASHVYKRRAELIGRTMPEMYPGVERSEIFAAYRRVMEQRKPERLDVSFTFPDGAIGWYEISVQPVPEGIFVLSLDITERMNSGRRIREQARLLDLIFRHSLDSIVLLDKDYNFIRVSESYAKVCQREVSAFPGHNHFDFYPSALEQEMEPFRREKKIFGRLARPFVFPDHPEWGTMYWDLGLVPILDQTGEIELFLFTLKDVTGQVRAEEKSLEYITQLKALSRRMLTVQEEERRAVARELHDEIGQGLTAVKIRLQAMELTCQGCELTFSTDNLHEALRTAGALLEQVRNLSLNLRPLQLDELGLAVALHSLIMRDAATAGWIEHFDEDLSAGRYDSNLELACYRVAQEALTNVMRHAGATEVWMSVRRSDQGLRLTVRDNGRGFDPASARSATGRSHLGLLGMEERIKNMAGQFEIGARRGEGTVVQAIFPIATAIADQAGLA